MACLCILTDILLHPMGDGRWIKSTNDRGGGYEEGSQYGISNLGGNEKGRKK
jgi:hypothetical protein